MGKRSKAREVYVIDAETDPFLFGREPKPFIWGCYGGKKGEEKYASYTDAESLLQALYEKHAVVFAHNGGRFDFLFLQDYFTPWNSIRIINGRIAGFRLNDCLFRDSFLILPTALRSFKKDKIDYSIFEKHERTKAVNAKKIEKYLENDCRYLHELVMGFGKSMEQVLPWLPPPCHSFGNRGRVLKFRKLRGSFMRGLNRIITAVVYRVLRWAYSETR